MRFSDGYERLYASFLSRIAHAPDVKPRDLAVFWPSAGAAFDGDLLIIGRAVNGSINRWLLDSDQEPVTLAAAARRQGESTTNGDQLGWIVERSAPRDGGYSTARSQFWATVRLIAGDGKVQPDPNWPSHIAWTNLAKLAPWAGGNPGGTLLSMQRELGPTLIRREIEELAPRRVVALTGRGWFELFGRALGLNVQWRDGLVEGIADEPGRRWVIAVHPMTRSPRAVAAAVIAALREPSGTS